MHNHFKALTDQNKSKLISGLVSLPTIAHGYLKRLSYYAAGLSKQNKQFLCSCKKDAGNYGLIYYYIAF